MTEVNKNFLTKVSGADVNLFRCRWQKLCEAYLPRISVESIWRFSRERMPREPSQGWKFHISATILQACDVFERVAPFLNSQSVQFKAPKSLEELSNLNCGLNGGYPQIGKFITVYPASEEIAVKLAHHLHDLTKEFFAVSVPFDEQYLPGSSVFYRYGAFSKTEAIDEKGRNFSAIVNLKGKLVLDDRYRAIPEWLSDPFQMDSKRHEKNFDETPLGTKYKIFRAITQRGKGGTYQAIEFRQNVPRLCIVKEGRRNGELGWNGQDGYSLVKNEFDVLSDLKKRCTDVPQVFESFEVFENFYFAMEFVEGEPLDKLMKLRKRRFSIKRICEFSVEIAKIIENIHRAGWVWNDCKPSNLIVSSKKSLRPIDFEGAFRKNETEPFHWKTRGFSKTVGFSNGQSNDFFALGAVVYFLLTGRLYDSKDPLEINKLRRNVPKPLVEIIEKLLSDSIVDLSKVVSEFENISKSVSDNFKDSHIS
jgi:hypothetical protein